MSKKITQEEFIARVKAIHGDRYGLEKAVYVDVKTPVVLHCDKHGDFPVTPDSIFHKKQGCGKCAGKGLTTEDFIKEAREVHGDRYDYSKTVYTKANKEVVITCREHGDFKMLPYNHVSVGCNCPECSNVAKLTEERFLKRAHEKFGNRFDYSLVNYINSDVEIKIRCNSCGTIFPQTPNNHLQSLQGGCPTCRYKYVADAEKIPFDEFVKRARKAHGDKYAYHEETYTDISSKTTITCKKHGDFEQYAITHVNGCGCDKCANEAIGKSLMLNTDIFRQRVKERYGDRFDLTDTVYKGWDENVTIKCNTCGEYFEQRPNNFLRGSGCPNCNLSYGETKIKFFLEDCNIDFKQHYALPNEDLFCSNKKLFVDFFLPDLNTIIEFNGDQHYRPVEIWGGKEQFEKQQRRDNAVRSYCEEHKITLIEIPYKDMANIENILSKELNIKKHD